MAADLSSAVARKTSSTRNPRDGAGGEVPVDRAVRSEDLDLAAVRELGHPVGAERLGAQAEHVTQEGHGRLGAVGADPDPGQFENPHGALPGNASWPTTVTVNITPLYVPPRLAEVSERAKAELVTRGTPWCMLPWHRPDATMAQDGWTRGRSTGRPPAPPCTGSSSTGPPAPTPTGSTGSSPSATGVKIRLVNEMDSDHPMHHPFHLHGAGRFLVLARDGVAEPNLVWKDTVLVRTGQTVDILFDVSNPGLWMAHCHIAEHMQSGMMFSFTVARQPTGTP